LFQIVGWRVSDLDQRLARRSGSRARADQFTCERLQWDFPPAGDARSEPSPVASSGADALTDRSTVIPTRGREFTFGMKRSGRLSVAVLAFAFVVSACGSAQYSTPGTIAGDDVAAIQTLL
jgi:hypothetical protein